jgi:hypothetical protein
VSAPPPDAATARVAQGLLLFLSGYEAQGTYNLFDDLMIITCWLKALMTCLMKAQDLLLL